jgi:hypothetical protein
MTCGLNFRLPMPAQRRQRSQPRPQPHHQHINRGNCIAATTTATTAIDSKLLQRGFFFLSAYFFVLATL